jgi:hypothetical protein
LSGFFTSATVNGTSREVAVVRRVVDADVALVWHRGRDRHLHEILGARRSHAGIVTSVATVACEVNEVLSSVWRSTVRVELEPESVNAVST